MPAVLVVADPGRTDELVVALAEPLPSGPVEVLVSTGGDDTIDLFESRSPRVVVLTATLEEGDAKSLIEALRDMVPRDRIVIVLVGDDAGGVVRTALDAIDMKPDRFVSRPLAAKALRFAVQSGLENVARALGEPSGVRGSSGAHAHLGLGPSGAGGPVTPIGIAERAADLDDRETRPVVSPSGRLGSPLGTIETAAGSSPVIMIGPRPTFPGTGVGYSTSPEVIDDEGSNSIEIDTDDIDEQQPAVARTGTPLRGPGPSGPAGHVAPAAPAAPVRERAGSTTDQKFSGTTTAEKLAAERSGAIPIIGASDRGSSPSLGVDRKSSPSLGGERSSSPSVVSADGPLVSRAPTDRGIGIATVPPAAMAGADVSSPALIVAEVPVAPSAGNGIPANGSVLATDRSAPASAPLRARWEALADSIIDDDMLDEIELGADDVDLDDLMDDGAAPLPPIDVASRHTGASGTSSAAASRLDPLPVARTPWHPNETTELRDDQDSHVPQREPTLIIDDPPPSAGPPAMVGSLSSTAITPPSLSSLSSGGFRPSSRTGEPDPSLTTPLPSLAGTYGTPNPPDPSLTERGPRERWSQPVLLSELIDRSRDSSLELLANVRDDLSGLDVDDDIVVGRRARTTPPPHVARTGQLQALEDLIEPVPPPELAGSGSEITTNVPGRDIHGGPGNGTTGTSPGFTSGATGATDTAPVIGGGRDFARQLRAKMSQMAQRLFQSDSPAQASDLRPRHDHHTEIDLASLGEELVLGGGVTEIESRAAASSPQEQRSHPTSPGSWDTAVRERGLPDAGDVVRGVSDTPMLLAKMFAQTFTGRVAFRRAGAEKVVFFDGGRPVFASSNESGDRMGELLVREGKITAAQYERCQVHVAQSGRRMGEILVDFGYLKRRELLPAVRRHVEDILYSLFSWDHGTYQVMAEPIASAERIRLSRHPASLVLEGIRRKLDRTTLEKLLGPASTIIEVKDRERLGGIINAGDLAPEERAALGGFDTSADLAQVARTTGVDIVDVLPLAWGLCVLGLATARRTEPDVPEDSTALVGETDLAIDRERVRARWQLVTEADYFALLGVRRDATTFEIRRAYQAARRDFAADCFPGDLRRELARELEDIGSVLDEAFRVLRDDRLRLTYLANLVE